MFKPIRNFFKLFTFHPVKFSDGKYGIRKFSFLYMSYTYFDLTYNNEGEHTLVAWSKRDRLFSRCRHKSLDFVIAEFNRVRYYVPLTKDSGTMLSPEIVTATILQE